MHLSLEATKEKLQNSRDGWRYTKLGFTKSLHCPVRDDFHWICLSIAQNICLKYIKGNLK